MCGVNGLINLDGEPVQRDILLRMNTVLAHRGPDGEGIWIGEGVGLGHRRLSILDLSDAGRQPMESSNKRYVLSYNGEIYNYAELKRELVELGCSFCSSSDTEVVLHALAKWGQNALLRFNGMFALAFWDAVERTLLLARDRYGVKPLYYCESAVFVCFASEQKAILEHPKFRRSLDKEALYEYFTFQNIFTDRTLYQDVKLLPPGHSIMIDIGSGTPRIFRKQYWDFQFQQPQRCGSAEDYVEELDYLFQRAVKRQLVSDVEIGAYLSGGIDSGAISGVASKSISDLKSFTCGFDLSSASGIELAYDERVKAEAMSGKFKTEHYEMVLKAGDMERCLPALTRHLEEPRVGQSYPNYFAAKLASKFVKVVLSGAGGDELFGGYPWRYFRAGSNQDFEQYIDQYYLYWQRLVDNNDLRRMFRPIWGEVKGVWTRDIFRNVFPVHQRSPESIEDYVNASLYFEAKTFLHGLLVMEDKLSMAHGLEARVPFLDNDLVDFAMRCPVGMKLNNLYVADRINENVPGDKQGQFFARTNVGKKLMRDVMTRHVPKEITELPKQGFSSPDASWFRGESIDFVRSTLLSKRAPIYEILDFEIVGGLIAEHLNGSVNRRLLIWSLLYVNEWLRHAF